MFRVVRLCYDSLFVFRVKTSDDVSLFLLYLLHKGLAQLEVTNSSMKLLLLFDYRLNIFPFVCDY